MLSQENINKILKEKVLSKTAADGDPWYAKAKNWATADNYSNLKNVGIGAGAAALAGGATYAASGLIPGLKKKRLARALMALGVGGAAGGAAGYYGNTIQDYLGDKLDNYRAPEPQAKEKPEALRKGTQAATDSINKDQGQYRTTDAWTDAYYNQPEYMTTNDYTDLIYGVKNMSSAEGQYRLTMPERMAIRKQIRADIQKNKKHNEALRKGTQAATVPINYQFKKWLGLTWPRQHDPDYAAQLEKYTIDKADDALWNARDTRR